jgi:hypothetical protein
MAIEGQSQRKQLDWSGTRKLKGLAIFSRVIGENEHGIYLLRYRNRFLTKQVLIERYDNTLNFIGTRPFTMKKARLLRLSIHPDGLLMLFVRQNKANRTMELYARKLDPSMEPIGKDELLAETPFLDLYTSKDYFRSAFSADRKHLMIYSAQRMKDDKLMVNVKLLDLSLKISQDYNYALSLEGYGHQLVDLDVDVNGNGYLIMDEMMFLSKKSYESQYRLYRFLQSDSVINDFLLGDTNSHLSTPVFAEDRKHGEMKVMAWESPAHKDKFNRAYCFRLSYNQTDKSYQQFTFLPPDVLNAEDEETEIDNDGFLMDFEILKVVNRSDGGSIIIAESSVVRSEEDVYYVNGLPHTSAKNIYNYDDIIVINLDSSGALDWSKIVPKSQSSINDGGYFSSVVVGTTPKGIHILYNENLRDNGEVIHYTIALNGKSKSEKLFSSQSEYVVIIPPESLQVSSNKLLIPSSKNRKFALLKITYLP